MTLFQIRVYGTQKLWNDHGRTPVDRASTWVNAAMDNTPHSADVTGVIDYQIDAPTEIENGRFYAPDPCVGGADQAWDHLSNWWHEYVGCNFGRSDCDLLITNYDSQAGRCVNNVSAVAEGGCNLPNLTYVTSDVNGSGKAYNSMQTALHEVGHAFLYGGADGFDEHKVGNEFFENNEQYRSPFHNNIAARNNGNNECGYNLVEVTENNWHLGFSDCFDNKMR